MELDALFLFIFFKVVGSRIRPQGQMEIEIPFTRKDCLGGYSLDMSVVPREDESSLEIATHISIALNEVVKVRGPSGWHMLILYVSIPILFVSLVSCLVVGVSSDVVVIIVSFFLAVVWLPFFIWTMWRMRRFSQSIHQCVNDINADDMESGVETSLHLKMCCGGGYLHSMLLYNNLRYAYLKIRFTYSFGNSSFSINTLGRHRTTGGSGFVSRNKFLKLPTIKSM